MLHELIPRWELLVAHIALVLGLLLSTATCPFLRPPSLFTSRLRLFVLVLAAPGGLLRVLLGLLGAFRLLLVFGVCSAATFATLFLSFLVATIIAIPIQIVLIQLENRWGLLLLLFLIRIVI